MALPLLPFFVSCQPETHFARFKAVEIPLGDTLEERQRIGGDAAADRSRSGFSLSLVMASRTIWFMSSSVDALVARPMESRGPRAPARSRSACRSPGPPASRQVLAGRSRLDITEDLYRRKLFLGENLLDRLKVLSHRICRFHHRGHDVVDPDGRPRACHVSTRSLRSSG